MTKRTREQVAAAAEAKAEKQRKAEAERTRKGEEKERKAVAAARVKEEKAAAKRKADEGKAAAAAKAAGPDRFLEVLRAAHGSGSQLFSFTELAKGLPPAEKQAFTARWKGAIADGDLPPGVGSLVVGAGEKAARKVFFLKDVVPRLQLQTNGKGVGASGLSVKERLLKEFDRLNERTGGRFYVSLSDLRQALDDVDRTDFDAALNDLRREWILTLSPAEGRHESIPAEVLRAGIMEDSKLLVYVARRES